VVGDRMKCYVAESVANVATCVNSITAMTVSQIFSSIKHFCCRFGQLGYGFGRTFGASACLLGTYLAAYFCVSVAA